jgi:hypothetical protein
MRAAPYLIRTVLGDPDFTDFEEMERPSAAYFSTYRVFLRTARYRGFPDEWTFAIHTRPTKPPGSAQVEAALSEARAIILNHFPSLPVLEQGLKKTERTPAREVPLLLISDDPTVKLGDRLTNRVREVFFIDAHNIPNTPLEKQPSVRYTHLIAAVRAKLNTRELSNKMFRPYEPNNPAVGWRFFGRKAELEDLVNARANYFVIGARRIGKTSLLSEVKRRLEERGEQVFMIACQYHQKPGEVIRELLQALDPKLLVIAKERQALLGEAILPGTLRTLMRRYPRVTLILDEIGNAITHNPQDDWVFMGVLREFSQRGPLRVLMSGFQEIYWKQGEYTGPFVNFANTCTLTGFTDGEIVESLLDPLSVWGAIKNKDQVVRLITLHLGRNPFLLQHLGKALFERIFEDPRDVDQLAVELLEKEPVATFAEAAQEIYDRNMQSPTERYLFLRCCWEGEQQGQRISDVEMTERWVANVLAELKVESTYEQRRRTLESLYLKGLLEPIGFSRSRHRVTAPIVYTCIRQGDDMEELLYSLSCDIPGEFASTRGVPT